MESSKSSAEMGVWCLNPLSINRGSQFCWWRKPEKITDL